MFCNITLYVFNDCCFFFHDILSEHKQIYVLTPQLVVPISTSDDRGHDIHLSIAKHAREASYEISSVQFGETLGFRHPSCHESNKSPLRHPVLLM